METKTHNPSFTVSLRGYDRVEVDEYLDSLAEALGQVDDAEEHNRRLQTHINRLNARIKDLEERIRTDEPKTGSVLAERIGILLREAEDAATETIARAEATAKEIICGADIKNAEAEANLKSAVTRGEEEAARLESAARAEAGEILAEAETRATARTRQIEQWAEQVVSHTRAEEARMLRDHQEKRAAAMGELKELAQHREAAANMLGSLRDALGGVLGIIAPASDDKNEAGPQPESAPPVDLVVLSSEPQASSEMDIADAADTTGEVETFEGRLELASMDEAGEEPGSQDEEAFEAKLEAWVSGGARHYKRG
jgi:DivIVA domain-containing protein